jgi:L-ascorbate metabolism protein UlaG (beta-lactamase superfamily)
LKAKLLEYGFACHPLNLRVSIFFVSTKKLTWRIKMHQNMKKLFIMFFLILIPTPFFAQEKFEKDVVKTSAGDLSMTFIGHGTLMFEFNNMVIHIDPVMREADYTKLPDADLILVTHEHGDHLDLTAIKHILKDDCLVIMTQACLDNLEDFKPAVVMKNGDTKTVKGILIEAIPAYNIEHKRPGGRPFHPKGQGNGYILAFGNTRVLVAGDTENIPEIKDLKNIDIAFLPMNLPYTMTPGMVADAAKAFRPKILYPYHFGDTNTDKLVELLKDETDIEVRIRKLD